ncbi:hypothetical protein MAE02_56160 [Microvirga aerophila]|uniref:Uncharacterized protein n=1 Tax=Microvirga aerophila TaxID=670291 RepID=A0A512C131_9HYPH|nr:hypothetical protein MAE02_56160 [Microvirga aerophila]
MAVSEHPAQKLKREKDPEQQVHHPQPRRVSDKGSGNKVGDGGEVNGQETRLEGDCCRAMAIEQAPQLDTQPPQRARARPHWHYRLAGSTADAEHLA